MRLLAVARARFARSVLAQRFLLGATWSTVSAVVSSAITLLMMILVARLLGREAYGQFIIVQSTLNMAGVFAGLGLGATATRYAAELRSRDTARLGRMLALFERTAVLGGLVISSILAVLAHWIASRILNAPTLGSSLAVAGSAVFFSTLDGYQKGVLVGFEAMRSFAYSTISGVVITLPIMVVGTQLFGFQGAIMAIVACTIVQAGISRYFANKELARNGIPQDPKGCLVDIPTLWRFALPAFLAGALVAPAHWSAQALLANTANGYAELAVLGIAMQWFNVILFLPSTAGRIVLPILTEQVTRADRGSSRQIVLYAMGVNAVFAFPLALIVSVLSPKIMSFYGHSFDGEHLPLLVAVLTAALMAVYAPVGTLLMASGRMWLGATMNAGWALVYVGVAYFSVTKGALGTVLALCAGYIAHTTWVSYFAVKLLWTK